jgi:protein subunit release factor A
MGIRMSLIKVTHLPTGETAQVDGGAPYAYRRSMYHMRRMAMNMLRSRLTAERNEHVVASYELPDNDPFPLDLSVYRRNIT